MKVLPSKSATIVLSALISFASIHSHATGAVPDELIIDAFVDGPSTLHLTPDGLYWTNGTHEKPGKWHGANEATYVNGVAWNPVWGRPQSNSGPDKSQLYPLKLNSVDVNFHLVAVTQERGEPGKEKRTPPIAKRDGVEFIVIIPDPESGPRWYRFSLKKR